MKLGNFDECAEFVLDQEGEYSNDPDDTYGETRWGVTMRADGATVRQCGYDFATLTRDQAKEVFREGYWKPVRGGQLPRLIAFVAFDMAVLHGIFAATTAMQRAIGVKPDGHIGPVTLARLASLSEARVKDACQTMIVARLDHFIRICKNNHTQLKFLKGWIARINRVENFVLRQSWADEEAA